MRPNFDCDFENGMTSCQPIVYHYFRAWLAFTHIFCESQKLKKKNDHEDDDDDDDVFVCFMSSQHPTGHDSTITWLLLLDIVLKKHHDGDGTFRFDALFCWGLAKKRSHSVTE